jgi:hypothetical protein
MVLTIYSLVLYIVLFGHQIIYRKQAVGRFRFRLRVVKLIPDCVTILIGFNYNTVWIRTQEQAFRKLFYLTKEIKEVCARTRHRIRNDGRASSRTCPWASCS